MILQQPRNQKDHSKNKKANKDSKRDKNGSEYSLNTGISIITGLELEQKSWKLETDGCCYR